MDIKTIAAVLIVGRIVSVAFIFFVLRRQYELMKLPIEPEVYYFRKVLFATALLIFIGGITAIVVDTLTILADDSLHREDSPSLINMIYVFINEFTAIISAIFIWLLYRLARNTADNTEQNTADALALSNKKYANKK